MIQSATLAPKLHWLMPSATITKVSREKGIRVAQHFAGHSDISTTQIYDHVLDQETEEAVRSAFA